MGEIGRTSRDCKSCGRDAEGQFNWFEDGRLCNDCAADLAKRLSDLLLLKNYSWGEAGMEISWDDVAKLMDRGTYLNNRAAMAILIPDKERWANDHS